MKFFEGSYIFLGNVTQLPYISLSGYNNKLLALSNEKIVLTSNSELKIFYLNKKLVESTVSIGNLAHTMTLLKDGSIALIKENSTSIDIWNVTSLKLIRSYDITGYSAYFISTFSSLSYYYFSKLQNEAVFFYIGYPSYKICSLNLSIGKLLYITDDNNKYKITTSYIAALSDTKLALSGPSVINTQILSFLIINPQNGNLISEFYVFRSRLCQ